MADFIGLEDDNYCVHTPIPVRLVPNSEISMVPTDAVIAVRIGGNDIFFPYPNLYVRDGVRFDLAPWVRLGMAKFQDLLNYRTILQTARTVYATEMQIHGQICGNYDGNPGSRVCDDGTITKTFVNCALNGGKLIEDQRENIKIWQGFPFSWLVGLNRSRVIPELTAPAIANKNIEFVQDGCSGTYIKWLNEYGSYNYWLFPRSREYNTSSEEYYRTNVNVFDIPTVRSNEQTVGFNVDKRLVVKDVILKKYWDTIKSLVGSPEVYMLKTDYIPGTQVNFEDWTRIIQSDVEFQRDQLWRNSSEVEFQFDLPKQYVQTRL